MIDTIRSPHIETLYLLAEADESTLQYPLPDHIFGFHAQQSVEKLLKALISVHERSYPFTHSLQTLIGVLRDCNEPLPDLPFTLTRLQPFAVILRYDFGEDRLPAERDVIREGVAVLKRYVFARIVELQGSSKAGG